MDKYQFLQFVKDHIKEYLDPSYADYNVKVNEVIKSNGLVLNGMTLHNEDKSSISPTIYLDFYYDEYMKGADRNDIMRTIAENYARHDTVRGFDAQRILDLCSDRSKVYPDLVLTRRNKDLLADVPHREIMNLSVIYRVDVPMVSELEGPEITGSILLHNKQAESLGYTEEELFKVAFDNLQTNRKAVVMSMMDVLMGIDTPIDLSADLGLDEASLCPMYVVSNESRTHGNAYLVDERTMGNIAEKLDDDLYLIPSSIHEIIVVPKNAIPDMTVDQLREMVGSVNSTTVSPEEQLSDTCYVFLKNEGRILEADEFKKYMAEKDSENADLSMNVKRAAHM